MKISQLNIKNRQFFIPAIIIGLIIIISIISFFIGKNINSDSDSPIPVISIKKASNLSYESQKVLGETIYNWSGIISDKSNNMFSFLTNAKNENGDNEKITLQVNLSDRTLIIKWDISKPTVASEDHLNYTVTSFDNLNIGDNIIVKSSEGAINNNINALEVYKLITP